MSSRIVAPARGIAPGDEVERTLDLHYGRRGRLRRVLLVTRARRSSRLDTDRLQGLRAELERCSVPWARRDHAYRCAGKRRRVLLRVPVIGRRRLRRLSLAPGRTDHLLLTLVFPRTAGNSLQGEISRLVFRLVAG